MKAGEFVADACSWDPVAPLALRRNVVKSESEWRSYSTAQYLHRLQELQALARRTDAVVPDGATRPFGTGACTALEGSSVGDNSPVSGILHALDIADAPFSSTMSIEVLPSLLAERWKSVGLKFANAREISDMRFVEAVSKSLDLIRLVHPIHGTVAGMCRSLHVLRASFGHYDISYSDPSLPFSIFVSCPPVAASNRFQRLAENVIHEALHLQLSLVERLEPLVIDGAEQTFVSSPWKEGNRTIRGLLHATYVFNNLRYFWKQVVNNFPNSSSFAKNRIDTINQEMVGARLLLNSPLLTVTGRLLASSSINF